MWGKLSDSLMLIAKAMERQAIAQERIASVIEGQQLPEKGDQQAAAAVLGVSARTVARNHDQWIEGVHYHREGRRVTYNLALLRDWQVNKNDLNAHQRAIAKWQKSLLSNLKKRA